ncbi:MAG: AAA family ATPase [Acetobacteraceae bacterium]
MPNDLFAGSKPSDVGYKIVRLEAENIKRIQAVQISPDGNLVEITGKNGQGKTSILDSIYWAMRGRGAVQSTPIRKGADKARIELDLGPIMVRRTFRKVDDGEGFSTSIVVEAADGARYPSPQKMLDSLMGELSIDPLAFMRMDGKAQFDMLRGFVRDFDFAAHEAAQREDYEARTAENRAAKQLQTQADGIQVPDGLPDTEIDEAALTDELARAGEHNGSIETRRANRRAAEERIERLEADRQALDDSHPRRRTAIEARRTSAVAEVERQIEALRARIASINTAADAELTNLNDETADSRMQIDTEVGQLRARLDGAGLLPAAIDTGELRQRIAGARTTNAGVAARRRRDDLVAQAKAAAERAAALTKAMEAREKAKAEATAKAELPIPGIGFGDGVLLLNGVPLDQASDAEQLRVSVAIAIALNPKLRVIRVRDGNVLDADGMKLLAELAAKHDAQVWVETVRSDDRMAFVIEDGRVRAPGTAAA